MATAQSQEWSKKVGQITAKAWTDANFKKRLLSDPAAGQYVARVTITPNDTEIYVHPSERPAGHYDVWGSPGALLACSRPAFTVRRPRS